MFLHNFGTILDRQRAGRAGHAALEELAKEFEACSTTRHHAQQHEEQRYDLADGEENRKGRTLSNQSEIKR